MDFFLRRTVQEHRLDTIEGKVTAVRETVPLLAKVRDRVAQADYLARAAQRLGVKEEVLWSEVRGLGGRGRGDAGSGAGAAAPAPRPASAERPRAEEVELVKALLAHPALAAELRGSIALEEIENEDCRAVAGTAFALLDRGGADGLAGRLQFEDERLRRLVTAWAADPGPLAEEHEARRAAARVPHPHPPPADGAREPADPGEDSQRGGRRRTRDRQETSRRSSTACTPGPPRRPDHTRTTQGRAARSRAFTERMTGCRRRKGRTRSSS